MRRTLTVSSLLLSVCLVLVPPSAPAQTVQVDGLEAPVRLIRDVEGLVHLSAANRHDLFFMQGWVHAQDRLFQMDLSRRQASGTLAEVLGPGALSSDVQLRTLGLRRAAERSLPVISDEARADLEAYVAGVNAWLATNPPPIEYGVLELTEVAPWTPVDSLVIAKLIAFGLSFDLDIDATLTLLTYVEAGDLLGFDGEALFFEDMFRSAPFDPASTVPDALDSGLAGPAPAASRVAGNRTLAQAARQIPPAARRLMERTLDRAREVPLLEAAARPLERVQGSNEWAVAGRHTANGRPLMANDPHLALDTPATFLRIHLRAAPEGLNVTGEGFPGVSYVILGENQYIAWGATTNPLDVTDTFLEEVVLDPDSPSGLSTVFMGSPEPIVPIPVEFFVNQIGDEIPDNLAPVPAGGGVPEAVLIVPRRNHGPIVELDLAEGIALSVQYTGFSGTREIDAFRIWNKARNLEQFKAGLQFFDVGSQNWAYTDQIGNIAYFTSAEMPLREDLQAMTVDGLPPFFLRDGTGGNEWLPVENPQPGQAVPYEILPFAEMPQVEQPPSGYFVNANNDPAGTTLDNDPLNQVRPGGGLYYLNPGYAGGFRAGRITRSLHEVIARGNVTPADMQAIQADVRLLDAEELTPYILNAWENATGAGASAPLAALASDPGIEEAVMRLGAWDYSSPTGLAEGWDASDVPGALSAPGQAEVDASVAATIYSAWRGQVLGNSIDAVLDGIGLPRPGSTEAMKAFRNLLDTFPERQGLGASGLDFFPGASSTPADRRDELLLRSLRDALDLLASAELAPAFGGSTDQDDYRWGKLHRIVFDHPLGGPFSIPPAGGAFPPPLPGLDGIPVDGGFGAVDASSHSARADGLNEFMFGSGPVRRAVVMGGGGRNGLVAHTSSPGGASGVLGSPFYANLLPGWLANEAFLARFLNQDVVAGRLERIVYVPGGN